YEAVLLETRRDVGNELTLRGGDFARLDRASYVNVRAEIVATRHTIDSAEHLAIEEEDALVSALHGGKVLLHHHEAAPFVRKELDDRAAVLVARLQQHDSASAGQIEWLDD